VSKVLINDFDTVKKGQLLVELRNDDFIAREKQLHSLYDQAVANTEVIRKQLELQSTRIQNAEIAIGVSHEDVNRSISSVGANVATLKAAGEALTATESEKVQAEAKLRADEAVELRARLERKRQEDLFSDGASTKQTVEQVVADHDRAVANVAADKADIARLLSMIAERKADITQRKEQLHAARAEDAQSVLGVSSKKLNLATERSQLAVLEQQLKQSEANAQANLSSWKEAQVALDYTKICAPVDGKLSERRVRAGHQVNAGTQVVSIVSAVPWVIASYRETQTRKIEVGDRAEVTVDALGGAKLDGKVQSLSPASEAQFALLPPDNPSGNFTKITQRVPIKIVFNPDQKLLARIKPGMTVIAKVWTH
jgi:membrane fusion protein (multidrug efflux system)